VTTDKEELENAQVNKDISAAWAGGENGSEIILKFIDELGDYITDDTVIYLLLSKENQYKMILSQMKEKYGMDFEVLLKRNARNEDLAIFKFFK
jgi:release factor glutamine methyltransferase